MNDGSRTDVENHPGHCCKALPYLLIIRRLTDLHHVCSVSHISVGLVISGCHHRISIPAYSIEQQRWQSDVPENEMSLLSLISKNDAHSLGRRVTKWLFFKNLLTVQ
jgi:hypothetical protein